MWKTTKVLRGIPLLPRGVVASAGTHLEVLLEGGDFNRAIAAVRFKISRMIRNDVLAAEFVFNRRKRILNVLHLEGKECAAAGRIRDPLQDLIATQDQAAVVGGNSIDDDFRALRHFNRLGFTELALIVLSITDHDDRASRRMVFMILDQILVAGSIDGVVE